MHDDAHHDHGHNPDDEIKLIDTGDGLVKLSIFEDGVPPRLRVHFLDALGQVKAPPIDNVVTVDTVRPQGERPGYRAQRWGRGSGVRSRFGGAIESSDAQEPL